MDEVSKKNSRAEIGLQVGDNDARVELLQIVVRPVRIDLSTTSQGLSETTVDTIR